MALPLQPEVDGVTDVSRRVRTRRVGELVVAQDDVARARAYGLRGPQIHIGHSREQRLRSLCAEVALEDPVASRPDHEVARIRLLRVAEDDPGQHGEAQHGPGGHAVVRGIHPVEMRMRPRAGIAVARKGQGDLGGGDALEPLLPDQGRGDG